MKNGTGFFVVLLIGYIAFEAYAVHRASYRTEPAYIHNMLIEARAAVEACDDGSTRDVEGFDRILRRVTAKYRGELLEKSPGTAVSALSLIHI